MSNGEIFGLIVSVTSIIVSGIISVLAIFHFNKKGHIYEIKKNAILRSLSLIDDYMSNAKWQDKKELPVVKSTLTVEYLTIEARECYNNLIITVRNPKLVVAFNRIVFSTHYNENGIFYSMQMQDYRLLCRKELGMKKMNLEKEITFINRVGRQNSEKLNERF